uniref:Uncharacterized protein n=1 Tax=Pipistrellus kuhlii TaxID=59472 RepID=A0A7J7UTQ7_PIPKU|nr:hypothetical protein mPipKuh1_008677 [Pipistrellus kuhlii]
MLIKKGDWEREGPRRARGECELLCLPVSHSESGPCGGHVDADGRASLVGERRLRAVHRHVRKPRTSVTELTVRASCPATRAHRSAVLAAPGSVPSSRAAGHPSHTDRLTEKTGLPPSLTPPWRGWEGLPPPRHSVLTAPRHAWRCSTRLRDTRLLDWTRQPLPEAAAWR